MDRMRIKSNDLKSVGYDESMQILEIEFHHGGGLSVLWRAKKDLRWIDEVSSIPWTISYQIHQKQVST